MNEREFCYWLQGLFEVGGVRSLDETQVQIVKDHLALVFKKVTPERQRLNTPNDPPVTMPNIADIYSPRQRVVGTPDHNGKTITIC